MKHQHLTTLAAWCARILSAAIQFFVLKEWARILDLDHLAAISIFFSMQGWLFLSDCQLGAGVQNIIAERKAQGKRYSCAIIAACRMNVRCFFAFSLLWTFCFYAVGAVVFRNLNVDMTGVFLLSFYISGLFLIASGNAQVYYKILMGEGSGYLSYVLQVLVQAVGYCLLLAVPNSHGSGVSLLLTSLSAFFPPAAIPAIFLIRRYGKENKFDVEELAVSVREISNRAKRFFPYSLLAAVVLYTDIMTVSAISSSATAAGNVTLYFTLSKIFAILFFVFNASLTATAPVISGLYVKNEFSQIKKSAYGLVAFGCLVISFGSVVLYFFLDDVLAYLSGAGRVRVSIRTFILFVAYQYIGVWQGTWAMLLNAMSEVRSLTMLTPFQAVLNVALMLLLGRLYEVNGIVMALIASSLMTTCWFLPMSVNKLLNK
ncbi:hypothetical protein [Niveibacterium terrae]|uniref:hypothetical protein n=1 Tax=Niveibacterium terrae TaxID=3373598 RepID=UPI003A8EF566